MRVQLADEPDGVIGDACSLGWPGRDDRDSVARAARPVDPPPAVPGRNLRAEALQGCEGPRATSSQEKRRARSRPRSPSSRAYEGPSRSRRRPSAMSALSSTFARMAASPATSTCDELLPARTGAPQSIASRIGRPNPSYREGKTKAAQRWYRTRRSSSRTSPVRTTRSVRPRASARRRTSTASGPVRAHVTTTRWARRRGSGSIAKASRRPSRFLRSSVLARQKTNGPSSPRRSSTARIGRCRFGSVGAEERRVARPTDRDDPLRRQAEQPAGVRGGCLRDAQQGVVGAQPLQVAIEAHRHGSIGQIPLLKQERDEVVEHRGQGRAGQGARRRVVVAMEFQRAEDQQGIELVRVLARPTSDGGAGGRPRFKATDVRVRGAGNAVDGEIVVGIQEKLMLGAGAEQRGEQATAVAADATPPALGRLNPQHVDPEPQRSPPSWRRFSRLDARRRTDRPPRRSARRRRPRP